MGFSKSVAITFLSNLFVFFLSIINTTILSRVLGPDGKGIVDVANNFLSFATLILGMGFAASNVYFLGKTRDRLPYIVGNNIIVAFLGFVLLIPFYFIHDYYQFKFLEGINSLQMIAVLLTIPLINLKAAFLNILLGLQEINAYNRINVLDKASSILLMIIFLLIATTPTAAILSVLAATMIMLLWQYYLLVIKGRLKPGLEMGLMREMITYGLKAQVGNVIQRINYRLDIFIVNYYLPLDQVGIYGIAVVLGETLWGVSGTIATLVFPIVSSATDKKALVAFTNQITRVSLTLIICFSFGLALISRPLITFWFGSEFSAASDALLWLLPGIAIFSVSNILANYLAGIGQIEKNIYSGLVSGVITVVFNIILIPRIGINGASIATTLSYIIFTLMTLIFYIRHTGAYWRDILILQRSDVEKIKALVSAKLKR